MDPVRAKQSLKAVTEGVVGFIFLISASQTAHAEDAYRFDPWHSEINFSWDHGGLSQQSAAFTKFDGELVLDEKELANSRLTVQIFAKSLSTGVQVLDGELTGEQYFHAKKFPKITFQSSSFKRTGNRTGLVTGALTVRDVTKPVTLDVRLVHRGENPLSLYFGGLKGTWLGIEAKTTLLRSDFGLKSFIPVISDRIAVSIVAELKMKKHKKVSQ